MTSSLDTIADVQKKVLIVEDDVILLTVAVEMFRGMGYEPLTAADGLEALETLRDDHSIGFLFSDVVMPNGMTGVDLAREARRLSPEIKVLLASGYPIETFKNSGEDGLADASFINKPYRTAELLEKLEALQ